MTDAASQTLVKDSAQTLVLPVSPEELPTPPTPDACFGHAKEGCPSVVIEVSCAERRKDLPRLAFDHIVGSRARISAVIGFDIACNGTKRATVSVWKPKVVDNEGVLYLQVEQAVESEPFRDEDGNVVSTGCLTLPLSDFAPAKYFSGVSAPIPTIDIPYARLASYLEPGGEGSAGEGGGDEGKEVHARVAQEKGMRGKKRRRR